MLWLEKPRGVCDFHKKLKTEALSSHVKVPAQLFPSMSDSVSSTAASLSFEEALARLEATVETMESAALPLDELVRQFEDGAKLVQACRRHLEAAELKIEKLKDNLSGLTFEPFDPDTSGRPGGPDSLS